MISQHSMQQIIGVESIENMIIQQLRVKDQHPEVIQNIKRKFERTTSKNMV